MAEVIEKGKAAGLSAKITELSLYGCYVEMPDPFAQGTQITVKIYSNSKYFEAQAIVAYSQERQGYGLCFQNVNPHYLTVLRQWIIESAQARFGRKL